MNDVVLVRDLQTNKMQHSRHLRWIDCYTDALPEHHIHPDRVGLRDSATTLTMLSANMLRLSCLNHRRLQQQEQTCLRTSKVLCSHRWRHLHYATPLNDFFINSDPKMSIYCSIIFIPN